MSEKKGIRLTCLSVHQPWASLIVAGVKTIQNREWQTRVQGRVYIHASKTYDKDGEKWIRLHFPQLHLPGQDTFPLGGIIGRADLFACTDTSADPWFFGPYGFVFSNPTATDFVPIRGQLKFFSVSLDEVEAIRSSLGRTE